MNLGRQARLQTGSGLGLLFHCTYIIRHIAVCVKTPFSQRQLFPIVPNGRDEAGFTYGMEWLRHHDRYDDKSLVDPYVNLE